MTQKNFIHLLMIKIIITLILKRPQNILYNKTNEIASGVAHSSMKKVSFCDYYELKINCANKILIAIY